IAQLPSAFSCHLSRVASRVEPLGCTAKSMIVVVPPHAAAFVPVSKVSTENVPPNGISMCVYPSIPPGITYLPAASMISSAATLVAVLASRAKTAAIFSPTRSTSALSVPSEVTTVPPLIRMLTAGLRSSPGRLHTPSSLVARRRLLAPASRRRGGPATRSWLHQALVRVRAAVPVELPQVPDLGQLVQVEV